MTEEKFDFISLPKTQQEETVWCKIGTDGELEMFDWEYVEKLAREYDVMSAATQKPNAHIICKLAVLIRKQTLERAAQVLLKYQQVPAEASTVVLKDFLEDE